jgi:hypothetical protein
MKKFQAPFRQETYLKRERERNTWIVPDVNQFNASLSISTPLPLPSTTEKGNHAQTQYSHGAPERSDL